MHRDRALPAPGPTPHGGGLKHGESTCESLRDDVKDVERERFLLDVIVLFCRQALKNLDFEDSTEVMVDFDSFERAIMRLEAS